MNTKYLITASEVKTICSSINNEIDDTLINNAILLMQDTTLKDSLTLDMWEDIFINSGTTANQYLINNYIKNLIAYSVWQFLVVTLSYQLNSAGVRLKISDHSQLAESSDIQYYRGYIQSFIDNVRRLMAEYIEDHQSDYPLYYIYEHGKGPSVNNFKIGRVGGVGTRNAYDMYDDPNCQYWRTKK
jgi:hypothetical protein